MGNLFFGKKGWMRVNGNSYKTFFGPENEPGSASGEPGESADPMNPAGAAGGGPHEKLYRGVRSGKRSDLNSEIEKRVHASTLPIMANVAYRIGETLEFDGKSESSPTMPTPTGWPNPKAAARVRDTHVGIGLGKLNIENLKIENLKLEITMKTHLTVTAFVLTAILLGCCVNAADNASAQNPIGSVLFDGKNL